MSNTKYERMDIRVTSDQKAMIKKRSKELMLDTSSYILEVVKQEISGERRKYEAEMFKMLGLTYAMIWNFLDVESDKKDKIRDLIQHKGNELGLDIVFKKNA